MFLRLGRKTGLLGIHLFPLTVKVDRERLIQTEESTLETYEVKWVQYHATSLNALHSCKSRQACNREGKQGLLLKMDESLLGGLSLSPL